LRPAAAIAPDAIARGVGRRRVAEPLRPTRQARILSRTVMTPDLSGRDIGGFRLLALIGRGGMGEVYRAHDARLGRDVAIKVLPSSFGRDAERLARFEREARVLASLNHPHIGAIYGIVESDGVRGLVLELVEGTSLASRIAAGLKPDEALAIASQMADALDLAHEKGIIHRDL